MRAVRLIHWHKGEAQERASYLQSLGFEVNSDLPGGQALLTELAATPPTAVVIDLGRLPSQGRDMGVLLRTRKATRHIPLVFAGGAAEKVEAVRALLPDAIYTVWELIGQALEQAIAHPPAEPVGHVSAFAAYAGRRLVDKLGIKANTVFVTVDAPAGFQETLGVLTEGAKVRAAVRAEGELNIWFVRTKDGLEGRLQEIIRDLGDCAIWIAWPKKSSGGSSDLSQQDVRNLGLAAGLVDYKICSIDERWSALLFTRRKR
jgi:hypothetical protein